jgi:hypothetical protein
VCKLILQTSVARVGLLVEEVGHAATERLAAHLSQTQKCTCRSCTPVAPEHLSQKCTCCRTAAEVQLSQLRACRSFASSASQAIRFKSGLAVWLHSVPPGSWMSALQDESKDHNGNVENCNSKSVLEPTQGSELAQTLLDMICYHSLTKSIVRSRNIVYQLQLRCVEFSLL